MTVRLRRGAAPTRGRPTELLFLSWGGIAERAAEIAAALGGEPFNCFPKSPSWRPNTAIRWAVSACRTVAVLVRRRPRRVIATNPPVLPGIIALAYGRLTGAPVVLDDHPGSFGVQGDAVAARLLPFHRRMVPRAAACLVTSDTWVDTVEGWHGRAIILHEAPDRWEPRPLPHPAGLRQVLYVCIFGRDEPVEEVLDAARQVPAIRLVITGDQRRFPSELRHKIPPNVTLAGLLPADRYRQAVYESDAVMALTTEPTSAMRAAFEGVWAGRPMVLSDWPLIASLFPHAVRVTNDAAAIRDGILKLADEYNPRAQQLAAARERQLRRWESQLASLRAVLGFEATADSHVSSRPWSSRVEADTEDQVV